MVCPPTTSRMGQIHSRVLLAASRSKPFSRNVHDESKRGAYAREAMLQSRTRVLLTAGYRSNFYCGTIVSVAVDHLEFWSMHAIVFVLQGDFCIELFLPVQSGCLLRASSAKPYAQTFWGLCEGLGRGSLGGGGERKEPTPPSHFHQKAASMR
jgi:hypothetical protein